MSTITFVNSYAQQERRLLADLLAELGPDAPTLCTGWTTRDLAAHIVVRERRPETALSMRIPPLHGYVERVRAAKAAQPYDIILDELRTPPVWSPVSNPLTGELANAGELFIHHEDARRAVPGWEPRELSPAHERALWQMAKLTARLRLRSLGMPVRVVATGTGEALVAGDNPRLTLAGRAGELTLFLAGRKEHARIEITGPEEAAARLRGSDLAI